MRTARWVRVDPQGTASLARRLRDLPLVPWEGRYHFRGEDELTLRYLLTLDALNFCFWPVSPLTGERWSVRGPGGESLRGYFALAFALRELAQGDPAFFAPRALAAVTEGQLQEVLGGIPLLPWRVRAVREVGEALLRFGSAQELFARSRGSCPRLVELVTANMPLFRDVALYRGREVPFHKRAQILCADLYGTFGGEGLGDLQDLDWLTAFADYKLPQLLWAEGALVLHPALAQRIQRHELLASGCPEEVELRAGTVAAVEALVGELRSLGRAVRPFEVDWILWNLSQGALPVPHPRVRTPFY